LKGFAMKIHQMMGQTNARCGFTLIEVTVVIAIMGMLAASAVLSLAHTSGQHRFDALCQQIQQADGLARCSARQSGNAQHLIFDLDRGEIFWESKGGDSPTRLVKIASEDSLELRTSEKEFSQGQVTIDCSPNGYSQSYVLCLSSKNRDPKWMVVAGLSGRVVWTNDETEMQAILKSLAGRSLAAGRPTASSGADAH
jgi:type II secretion system protein H